MKSTATQKSIATALIVSGRRIADMQLESTWN